MFSELRNRVKKAGQPPGTPVYMGEKNNTPPRITVVTYAPHDFHEPTGIHLEDCLLEQKEENITWVHIEGLHDVALIEKVAKRFDLHPLTVEDILNVEQRSKVEEYENYLFVTLKMLQWHSHSLTFSIEQLSLVVGKKFILSFQEKESTFFQPILERLRSGSNQRLRQQGGDYLAYRLIDSIIDQYFVVLEGLGDQIETTEESIMRAPTSKNAHTIYQLKRQMMTLRKAIWPVREVLSHLLQIEEEWITPFTRLYLRDAYDHAIQAIDNVETFRDMLSSLLDVYLSGLSNRMNEIMKTLTIIATIFIPTTFIASIYGMNFEHMPELHWHYGYPLVLSIMLLVTFVMLIYFRRKKWL